MNKGKIESSLGKVSFDRPAGNRVLTVDDASEGFGVGSNVPVRKSNLQEVDKDLENQLEAARREKLKPKASSEAKKRLEILVGIARLAENVEVDGVTFSIRSLKAREMKEVIESVLSIENGTIQMYEMRAQTMARAIYEIDGQDVEYIIGSNNFEDMVNFVQEMDESLLNYLYSCYTQIVNKNKAKFEDLGKTEEEIVENVKK